MPDIPISARPVRILDTQRFVGREQELRELEEAHSLGGGRRFFLLTGEAGIGKTHLAQRYADHAKAVGKTVIWANCWERDGSPPYWHWIQLIRQSISTLDKTDLCRSMGRSGLYLAKLAPDLEDYFSATPDAASSRSLLPDEALAKERFKLFDAISEFLRVVARDHPIVAVFDDLYAADLDSLELLLFVARESRGIPILFLGICRSDFQYSELQRNLIASLERESRVIKLEGLQQVDIDEFARKRGFTLSAAVVAELYRTTDGNPLFLDETLRVLKKDNSVDTTVLGGNQALVSDRIKVLVRHRLSPLSDAARQALEVAAIIGREFEADIVAKVLGHELVDVLDDLAEPLELQLLQEGLPGSGKYRFVQGMVAETITSDLPRRKFFDWHRRVGETLEEVFASHLDAVLPQVAYHYLRAEALGPIEKALKYGLQSATRALGQLAYEEAERLASLAIAAQKNRTANVDDLICELHIVRGDARNRSGKQDLAKEDFLQAATIAREIGRSDFIAKAALKLQSENAVGNTDRRLIALLEEALRRTATSDRPMRAKLLSKLARCLYWSDKRNNAESLSREAVATARETTDVETLVSTLFGHHYALWSPDNLAERILIANEAVDLSERLQSKEWAIRAHEIRIADLLEQGEVQLAEFGKEAYRDLAAQIREEDGAVQIIDSMTALLRGNLSQAEDSASAGFQLAQRWRHPRALLSYAAQITMIRSEQGRLAEMLPLLEQYAVTYPRIDLIRCALALSSIESGNVEQARIHFEYFAANDFANLERNWNWLATLVVAAEVCVFLKDTARADILYRLLAAYGERNVMLGWYEVCFGAASRALGILSSICGNFSQAEKHFENALSMNQRIGAVTWIAHTQENYAAMLVERSAQGDQEKGAELVRAARATAHRFGLKTIELRLMALLKRLAQPDRPKSVGSDAHKEETPEREATVTLLFSDVVNSTRLVEALGDLKAQTFLHEHDRVIRESIARYNGREIKTLGDGFMIAFGSARQAILCGISIQRAITALTYPDAIEPLRVRIGVHTGEPLRDSGDFFGKAVIVAARISAQAAAGDILVSEAVKNLTDNAGDLRFDEGHAIQLKGLDLPYRVFRVIFE